MRSPVKASAMVLMAEFGKPGKPKMPIPMLTQGTLADLIGNTRSRVSFFMNRFRKLGLITYNARIRVNRSLLNVLLQEQIAGHHTGNVPIMEQDHTKSCCCAVVDHLGRSLESWFQRKHNQGRRDRWRGPDRAANPQAQLLCFRSEQSGTALAALSCSSKTKSQALAIPSSRIA